MSSKCLKAIAFIGLFVLWMAPATALSQKTSDKDKPVKLSQDLSASQIDQIIAGLSDEQVRRLLIDELKMQAKRENLAQPKQEGIAGFIERIKNLTVLMQTRIEFLRSSGKDVSQEASGIYALLGTGERGTKKVSEVILNIAAVLAGGLLIQWFFMLYTAPARRNISSVVPSGWKTKVGALSMGGLLDLIAIFVLVVSALAFFFLFLDRTFGQRVLLAAYLSGIAIFQIAGTALRFFLAPREPNLRIAPFGNETANFLYYWLLALAFVITFGNVTVGAIRLAGAAELTVVKARFAVSLIAAAIILWMILRKRKTAAEAFSQGLPENSLRYRLAWKWHHLAVFGVLLLLASATLINIMGLSSGQAILTLLLVPIYLLLDWILRSILEAAFGLVDRPGEGTEPLVKTAEKSEEKEIEATSASVGETSTEITATARKLDLERMKDPLRFALRLSLAALILFWILSIWNIKIPVGEVVVWTVIKILMVVLLCYIAYTIANAAIMRRLSKEMPAEENEDAEEGGSGGSRIGTLLMLLRKFLLVVIIVMAVLIILSSLGVNIGPLIAGAGVFGLAIGFGAQTLVKDIIAGVFFLIDDAVRVGDYVECGSAKGMVEQISLRSLRLRHPRGKVHILPFGDISNVTNLSRDYTIMKLDFRVRYDADVEKIRKIIKKKVYQPILENPELGPKLLDKIKSQGVREMDDSAMIMRVKYKTKPGDQFVIRKEVFRLMQEAFKEEGIEFAHKNVTVYMPPEPTQESEKGSSERSEKIAKAAAAAVLSAEEEEKLAQKSKEKES